MEMRMNRRDFIKSGFITAAGTRAIAMTSGFRALPPFSNCTPIEETGILVKVLGSAQDAGIPHIGCYCLNCQRARKDPRFARLKPSIAVLDMKDKKAFIVDASPDISSQYDRVHEKMAFDPAAKINVPDGILLTHAHIGHYTGLMYYGYEGLNATKIPVYCTSKMGRFLEENGPWSQLVNLENIALYCVSPEEQTLLTPRIAFTPVLVPHRDEYSDTVGFIIGGPKRKLLYIPDIQNWKVWDRSIREEVEKVDFAFLDGTFYSPDELPGRDTSKIGHPFIIDSMDVLAPVAKSGKRIYFTHLNHSNRALDPDGPEQQEIKKRGFCLASDGMEIPL
jgi:pyrroloquinoline quinone biosynthesis protein B